MQYSDCMDNTGEKYESDLCYTKERRIHLGSLLLKIVLKWKRILVFVCFFTVLGCGYAKFKQTAQSVPAEESAADAGKIIEETPEYEIAEKLLPELKENIENTLTTRNRGKNGFYY